MSDLPAAPVPSDADLQDFPYMPLHVARLRDSDLAAEGTPEGCWYAVLLWAAAWHQKPAGSLPNSDTALTRFCGLGRDVRTFRRHRATALRGFVLSDDNRLYHSVVVNQVLAAWRGKIEHRHRTECARIKKANQRNGTDDAAPTLAEFVQDLYPVSVPYLSLGTKAHVPREICSKGEGEGEGEGDCIRKATPSTPLKCAVDVVDQPSTWDLLGLTNRIARTGAVSLHRETTRARAMDLVKGWLAQGIDVEGTIIPTVERQLADTAETSIGGLEFYAGAVLKAHQAKRRADRAGVGKPKAQEAPDPIFAFDDERDMVEFRTDLFGALGKTSYGRFAHRTRFSADEAGPEDKPFTVLTARDRGGGNFNMRLMDGERMGIVKRVAREHGFTDVW